MIALALLYLVPLAWTFVTSLKTQAEASAGFDLWPESPSLAAYREIWAREDLSFVTFFQNSLLLAASITAINLFLATLGGYAFARLRFPLRQYFLTIPREYEEAAKLDGAGYFKTFWGVMLPLAAPAVAAVAILTFQ